jgi:hypothetical protein
MRALQILAYNAGIFPHRTGDMPVEEWTHRRSICAAMLAVSLPAGSRRTATGGSC